VDAVRKEAKKAKKEMEAKNPELKLKHDPTQILPKARDFNLHHQHHHQLYGLFRPVVFREPTADGVQNLDRQNRGRAHIQMAIRTLENEVYVPLLGPRVIPAPP
jgi:hypothetical protein